MEGVTERHLPKTDDCVITPAGEHRKDIQILNKRKSSILLLRKATVIWSKVYHFRFVSSLYILATLTLRPDNAIICLR